MPTPDTFPTSMVLHFPPIVYQKTVVSEMLPKLLQIFQADSLRCVQFLRSGKIRVTFRAKADRDHYLSEGVRFEDQAIPETQTMSQFCTFGTCLTKWLARMSSTSSLSMVKFLQWNAPSPLTSPVCAMGTVLSRWSFSKTFRISLLYVATDALCSTVANQFSVLCVEKSTITDEPPVDLESDPVPINVDNPPDPVEPPEKPPGTITDESPVDLESDHVPINVDNPPDPVEPPGKPPVKAGSKDVSMTTNPIEPPEKPPVKVKDKSPVVKVASKDVSMTDNGFSKSRSTVSTRVSSSVVMFVTVADDYKGTHDYGRPFDCVRCAIRKSSRANIVKMPDSELRTFMTDALTKYKCRTDEPLLIEDLFLCVDKLKKHWRTRSK